MRIAWVSFDFEEYSVLHVNEMAKQHDVMLVLPEQEDDAPELSISDQVKQCRFQKPRLRQPLRQRAMVKELTKRINDFNPDVIHFQQGHLWFNFGLRKLAPTPIVITVHDPRHHAGDMVSKKTPQWVIDYGFRKADHVVVHGNALADQVQEIFGFARDHIHVVPHVAMGPPSQMSHEKEEPKTVLFFGRIWEYKGLDTLIQAEPLVSSVIPDINFVIAGQGEDFGRYDAMIQNPDRFEIHNRYITDEERVEFFERSSVVLLPYNEATQSGVVPVAYNHGRPVIATDVGALSDCVEDGKTGLLIQPRDPQALADAIVKMVQDQPMRHAMGHAGHEMVSSKLSPPAVAAQTLAVYQAAVESKNNMIHESATASKVLA